ncbi:MAG TPA: M24 family metallopeptidase [Chloroflexota bacterium]|nr:M24 family metallopeptidase [Chloroflexota bacterium]
MSPCCRSCEWRFHRRHFGPDVAVDAHAADPHYSLDDGEGAAITADSVVLIDLWARIRDVGDAPSAESTWMAYTGLTPPPDLVREFAAACAARDAALAAIEAATRAGMPIAAREVDRIARVRGRSGPRRPSRAPHEAQPRHRPRPRLGHEP